jgi:serine/threonine protein kinase/Flp pilus assembly protein TadD
MNERSIFMEALAKETPGERSSYLDEACGGDAALRQRVEALLASHEGAGSFLGKAVPERLAEHRVAQERPEETRGEPSAPEKVPASDDDTTAPRPIAEGPGGLVGPYKLLQEIGEGGMGTVYLAEQSQPVRRMVALKIIKPGMDSRQVIARFEAERQALALMDHPNIARVLDAGTTENGRPYFVMELVKGVPITKFCDERRLTPRQRLELFVPVCQAVQHAHQKGIIHRDIKPSNVLACLYDGRPVPKVIDFGIAKATGQQLTERTMFTEIGQVVGTLEYMSPEQAELNQLDIDTRSDIYSLGVLLYELLTGSTPLERNRLRSAGVLEVLRLIREEEPPRPSTRLSESKDTLPAISAQRQTEPARLTKLVRGELDWIVMKALEKDRGRRYETANDFAQDVQHYLADEPVLACPPSAWYRGRKFVRRHRAGLGTAAALLLVLLSAGAGVGLVLSNEAARSAATERTVRVAMARAAQLADQAEKMPNATSAEAEAVLVVWQQAEDALAGADAALTTGADDKLLRQQVAAVRAHLRQGRRGIERGRARALRKEKLFRDLEEARLARAAWVDGHYDFPSSATKYAAAFAAYGLDVTAERKNALARRMAAEEPKVRDALIVALGDWALAAERPRTRWSAANLLALAGAADDNVWRKRFLTAALAHDKPALRRLSARARRSSLPPSSLVQLAGTLYAEGEHKEPLAVLRWGRGRHPTDFWLHFELGNQLYFGKQQTRTPVEREEAIGCYRAALALRPEVGAVHANLAYALYEKGELDEALAECHEAVRLQPDQASAQYNLGLALHATGQVNEAISAYRKAIRLKKNFAAAHCNLGNVLREKGRFDEAIAESLEAIRLKKDLVAEAHNNLGLARHAKGQLDKAIAAFHEAIRLKKDDPIAYGNLGNVLQDKGRFDDAIAAFRQALQFKKDDALAYHGIGIALRAKGQLDEAITAFRQAVRLKKDFFEAFNNLGVTLAATGRLDEAIAAFQEAVRLRKQSAMAHNNLGIALSERGRVDDAIAAFREAIRLKKDYAEAHGNLGLLLGRKGQFREALEELRRSHKIGSRDPRWPSFVSAQRVRQHERVVELDGKLPAILQRKIQPSSPGERLELAYICYLKHLHSSAAVLYEQAFAAQPNLEDNLDGGYRYNAACAAALAGCSRGKDADQCDGARRARLRRLALSWLKADLGAWRRLLDKEPDKYRLIVAKQIRLWLDDADFAGVRGPAAIAKLPEVERPAWKQLWRRITDTLTQVQAKPTPKSKSNH